MFNSIALIVFLFAFVFLSVSLLVLLKKSRAKVRRLESEVANQEEKYTNAISKMAEESNQKSIEAARVSAIFTRDQRRQQRTIDALKSDLKEANHFLNIALAQLPESSRDDILSIFISFTRARIQGDEPLVHSDNPFQGLQREASRHRLHSV